MAMVMVWFNRKTMLVRRGSAVTEVLHPDDRVADVERSERSERRMS